MKDLERAVKIVSKEALEEYEEIRRMGTVNMDSYNDVSRLAMKSKRVNLATLSAPQFIVLLINYPELLYYYGLKT